MKILNSISVKYDTLIHKKKLCFTESKNSGTSEHNSTMKNENSKKEEIFKKVVKTNSIFD